MNAPSGVAVRGFATAPLVGELELGVLAARFDRLGVPDTVGFFASANDLPRSEAAAVDADLRATLGPALARLLPDHRPFLASFLVKGRCEGARIAFHQDLTYTDERKARTVVVWLPLTATSAGNGSLALVPGSHHWTTGSRPGGLDELPTEAHQEAFARRAELLDVAAGTAVLYDAGTVHGSPPNLSEEPRVAVGVALVPRDAPLVHVHLGDDDRWGAHHVDDRYYTEQGLRNRPRGYPVGTPWAPPVTADDFDHHLQQVPE